MPVKHIFNLHCKKCKRLARFLQDVKSKHPDYLCQPVAAFGDPDAQLLIVGLAPGMHGANATGRPFTGDHSGILLYQTLYKYGFSSAASSESAEDGLELLNCRITNAVKCLPPQNKPLADEIKTCLSYLAAELTQLADNAVIVALGSIAHQAVLKALGLRIKDYKFRHQAEFELNIKATRLHLISSYHCSRYNTQTKRLTETMFHQVFCRARQILNHV
ncbi:MAG: uracil-DNA glycosylase [Gammaproteobacteria bacterium]|nr:uracil-DNA glycosylase [Gammaproteobacteria bacterium]